MSTSKVHPTVIFLFLSLLPNLILARNPNSQLQVTHSRCRGTPYSDLCVSTLASFTGLASLSFPEIISGMLHQSASEVRAASTHCTVMKNHFPEKIRMLERQALDICLELSRDILDDFDNAVSYLESSKVTIRHYYDLQSLLSGVMTNVYTCTDELDPHTDNLNLGDSMKDRLSNISRHVSNSLFLLTKMRGVNNPSGHGINPSGHGIRERFPAWMSLEDSLLVQTPTNAAKFDLVVAKDGSGNFTSINDAVAAAPDNSSTRFVIYIKEGDYLEYVTVSKTKTNLMFVGDGIEKTLIKGNRNNADGWNAYWSATVAIEGDGFLAKGITFENFAGPTKGQAAAFRSRSDKSALFQCNFLGYQDTMYVHSHRQFYRDCDIYGTTDFIFGDAAVVFQNCNLYARKPKGRRNVFTAQGREDPLAQTGMSFLGCNFTAAPDLAPVQSSFKTFLGRPWKEFSRTVIMESYIGDLVDPTGWSEYRGSAGLSTLFYGEYQNRGPGSNTNDRVKWPGYKVITSSTVANQFTVESFIQGNQWLDNTGFPYYSGLN